MNTKTFFMLLLLSSLTLNVPIALAENDHKDEAPGGNNEQEEHTEGGAVILSTQQIEEAGIVVKSLQPEIIRSVVKAPGEVKFNLYKTAAISPRITSQVIGCFVELGEMVRMGQSIVTLSSVEMAEAQGALLVADREWMRVKKLGRKVVSESRYTQAKINWELAKGKVRAYGMNETQINELIASEDFSRADGRFELVATHGGVVLKEN